MPTLRRVLMDLDRGDRPAFERARTEAENFLLAYQKHKGPIQAIRLVDADGFVLLKIKEGAIVPHRIAHPRSPGVWGVFHVEGKDSFRMAISQPEASAWLSNFELGKEDPGAAEFCPAMFRYSTPLLAPPREIGAPPGRSTAPGRAHRQLLGREDRRLRPGRDRSGHRVRGPGREKRGRSGAGRRLPSPPGPPCGLREPDRRSPSPHGGPSPGRACRAGAAPAADGVFEHPETGDILVHRFYSPYNSPARDGTWSWSPSGPRSLPPWPTFARSSSGSGS